jgi:radical SAM superfamily enzyme YgiQ (UPF0313 family)
MAKILFCHPLFLYENPAEAAVSSPYFPLGLLYLAGYVRERGHEVAVFDGTFAKDRDEFTAALQAEQPEVVGFSALLPTRETALALAQTARRVGAYVVFGGPDPTYSPEAYLVQPQVDLVVHHEGEQTMAALLDRLDRGELTLESLREEPGIAFRAAGEIVINQPRPPIENLDELPLPARDLVDMDRYLESWEANHGYASMTISTTRGCPYGCEWCRDSVHGQGYRQRSPENVAAEVKHLKEIYRIDRLRVIDDVDGMDRDWITAWSEAAEDLEAVIPFEALSELKRQDVPMLDLRDSL